ncbi:MAG: DUF2490 domain-containing protein [Candidatus Omnitrophica bacterium]|nr:DUF2490 domain-containing protein [Candidatus Omnitrophota bacterium]
MKKYKLLALSIGLTLIFTASAYARDWELWNSNLFTVPLTKKINYNILAEWRYKNDMNYNYLYKIETGPSYKINDYFDVALWYIYQEKQGSNKMWDRVDLSYVDLVAKVPLKQLFDIKVTNRLRHQYDYDKAKSTIRDALKFQKSFQLMKNFDIAPYIQEEPFYDCKANRIVEHRSSAGLAFTFFKKYALNLAYMLNSKKAAGSSKWGYTNVLQANLNLKF